MATLYQISKSFCLFKRFICVSIIGVFFNFIFNNILIAHENDVLYTLSFDEKNVFTLNISLDFTGHETGSTEILLPRKFEQIIHSKDWIKDLKCYVDEKEISLSFDENSFILEHSPGAKMHCTYKLQHDDDLLCKTGTCSLNRNFITPFFSKDALLVQGLPIFVVPKFPKYNVRFKYNFPKNRIFYNNISKSQEVEFYDLKNSALVIIDKNLKKDLGQYSIISINGSLPENLDLLELTDKIFSVTKEYFLPKMNSEKLNMVFINNIMQTNSVNPIEGHYSKNNIFLKFNSTFHKNDFVRMLFRQISRMFLENWVKNVSEDNKNKWFFEGFSKYLANNLALKIDLTEEEYINNYNALLKQYYLLGSLNQISNKKIDSKYWNNEIFRNIVSTRGEIIAHELHDIITMHSNKQFELGDLIRNIFAPHQNIILSSQEIAQILSKFIYKITLKDYNNFLTKAICQGQFEQHANSVLQKFHLKYIKSKAVHYGFDVVNTFVHGKIMGIEKSSPAYQKGLRNFQKILSYSYDGETNMKISVMDKNNHICSVDFIPNKKDINIPQYVLK
ncbi:MAG: hypothetical protein ISN64_00175 [Rickettsia sp.]|nr:hypothetical protein [Rickettsia sp.]